MKKGLFAVFNMGNQNEGADYSRPVVLFDGLQREESNAIRYLYLRITGMVRQIGNQYGLTAEEAKELTGDCVALLLLKIRTGQYTFQGFDPATFAIEIAKNKVRHFKKRHIVPLTEIEEPAIEPEPASKAVVEILEQLLLQLPANCQKLIRLKYLEEMKDKTVIDLKMTQYTTVDALKNHRAQCMKKLVELGMKIRAIYYE